MDSAPAPHDLTDAAPRATRPPTRRKRRRRNWNAYAAIIASLVGLLALLVSGYTAYLQRQQVSAQVWPHLALWWSTKNYKIFATNEGTGPARVTRVRVAVDGRAMSDWDHVLRTLGYGERVAITTSTLHTKVLTAGQSYDILLLDGNQEGARKFLGDIIQQRGHTFGMLVCYCSVLEECWVASLGHIDTQYGSADRTVPVESCPIPPDEGFRD